MKQLLLCLSILCCFGVNAQPYSFSTDSDTYTSLTGGTSVNNGTVWSGFQQMNIPLGFTFDFMDASFTSVNLEATGRLIFDVNHYYWADLYAINGLQDKGTSASLSPITYELTGTPGSYIGKIQIENAEVSGDTGSTVNFQMWLYENGTIELHMGATTIDWTQVTPTGALGGVFHVTTWSPPTYDYGLITHGDFWVPSDTTVSGTGVSTAGLELTGPPQLDTIHRYGPGITNIQGVEETLFNLAYNVQLGAVVVASGNSGRLLYEVRDLNGRTVKTGIVVSNQIPIDLPAGAYIIWVRDVKGAMGSLKFVRP